MTNNSRQLIKEERETGLWFLGVNGKNYKILRKQDKSVGLVFVHGFLGSADSWGNFPLDLVNKLHGHNFRVYRFTLPSQGSYEKALVQLRNEIVLLSTQLDGLIFLCHSLGGLLVAQMLDKLEHDKVLGIIAFDAPYFGLSNHVSSVALSKTSQTVVDPFQNVASSVYKSTTFVAQNIIQGVAKGVTTVGNTVLTSTKYVSNVVVSSTTDAISQVSETAVNISQSAYETSTEILKSGPTKVISQTASYISEIPGKTINYMVEIPIKSLQVVGNSIDTSKTVLTRVFYGENKTEALKDEEKSIKDLEKNSIQEIPKSNVSKVYTENIKTPLIIEDEKDLGTFLISSPSDPWDSWIRLGLASIAIVSSGISYSTPIGFAKNVTRNLLLAHGVSALNEARKTIQFLYPPLWGDSVSSITQRMTRLTDRIYFKCFYVKHDTCTFINLPPSCLNSFFVPIETDCTDIIVGHMNLFSQTLNKDRYWTLLSMVHKELNFILRDYKF